MAIALRNYLYSGYVTAGYVDTTSGANTEAIAQEAQQLATSAIIDLYEVNILNLYDINGISVASSGTSYTNCGIQGLYRFHNNTDFDTQVVTWQGNIYYPAPIEVSGFEKSSKGVLPRPIFKISNIGGVVSSLNYVFQDMVGATVTRKRTFEKFLDATNFTGNTNPTADPTAYFDDEVYVIDRKAYENYISVEYELATPWDLVGVQIPRRQIIQNVCIWQYRGDGCGYTGNGYTTFTGSVTGTTLTVSAMLTGTLQVNMSLVGTGINSGTYILGQNSGTVGGVGTYSLSQSAIVVGGSNMAATTFYDIKDNPVSSLNQDVCGKRLVSCNLRFPGNSIEKPFGGFPAVGLIS